MYILTEIKDSGVNVHIEKGLRKKNDHHQTEGRWRSSGDERPSYLQHTEKPGVPL